MGVFFDFLNMLTTLFERSDQDDDPSEIYSLDRKAHV